MLSAVRLDRNEGIRRGTVSVGEGPEEVTPGYCLSVPVTRPLLANPVK